MALKEKLQKPGMYLKTFVKWTFLGLLMGVVGGLYSSQMHIFPKSTTNPSPNND